MVENFSMLLKSGLSHVTRDHAFGPAGANVMTLSNAFDSIRTVARRRDRPGPLNRTMTDRMQTNLAIVALSALAQESRFAAFRLLVQAGPQGQSASNIAATLDMPASSLSFHLKELTHAGLVAPRQQGRFIFYRARVETLQGLMEFLSATCGNAGAQSMQERLATV
jgi:ArsR family transcriptional regulator